MQQTFCYINDIAANSVFTFLGCVCEFYVQKPLKLKNAPPLRLYN